MVVLAVGAHPDDIEFGCYGTLAKLHNEADAQIYSFIFTSGERTSPRIERIKEARESGRIIGAKVKVLNYVDGELQVNGDVIERFTEEVNRLNPETVFTLHPEDTHQDHRAVANITLSSCRRVPTILFYETPQTKCCFAPNYFVDITNYFNLKEKALQCFHSQKNKPYLNIEEVRGLSQYRAYKVFSPGKLFEAFVLYRAIK